MWKGSFERKKELCPPKPSKIPVSPQAESGKTLGTKVNISACQIIPFQIGKRNLIEIVRKSENNTELEFSQTVLPLSHIRSREWQGHLRHQNKDKAGGLVLQHLTFISNFPGEHLDHPHTSCSGVCHRQRSSHSNYRQEFSQAPIGHYFIFRLGKVKSHLKAISQAWRTLKLP